MVMPRERNDRYPYFYSAWLFLVPDSWFLIPLFNKSEFDPPTLVHLTFLTYTRALRRMAR